MTAETAEVVSIVLKRISEWRFDVRGVEGAEEIVIPIYEPTASELDGYMKVQIDMLWKALQDTPEAKGFSGELRHHWSDFWTFELLKRAPLLKTPEELMPSLRGKSYEEVVKCVWGQLLDLLADEERISAVGRETLPKIIGQSSVFDQTLSDELHDRLANFYARRLSKQFPKLVDRAYQLSVFTAEIPAPTKVARYMEEASKCYLYGQRIACLMVCRSAIEFAIPDRLVTLGYGTQLEEFKMTLNKDSLLKLIKFSKELLPQYMRSLDDSERVCKTANSAVHREPPDDEECQEIFLLTRSLLQNLYSESDS